MESHLALLQVLQDASPRLQKAIIANIDKKTIEAIAEVCHNYLCGNIKCTKHHFEKLKKHQVKVRKLAGSKEKTEEKRQILLQSGNGFLGLLLTPIISELASYLANKVLK